MVLSIGQVQQELDEIKKSVINSSQDLEALYDQYIFSLSESVQKQLILSIYQLCTQIYPEEFVSLSLTQRQELQQAIRKLGQEMPSLLAQKPTAEDLSQEQTDLEMIADMLKNLPLGRASNEDQDQIQGQDQVQDQDSELDETQDNSLESEEGETEIVVSDEDQNPTTAIVIQTDQEISPENLAELSWEKLQSLSIQPKAADKITEIDLSNPRHLLLWQKKMESKMRKVLNDVSCKVNKRLQDFEILPKRLPAKVLELALKAGENGPGKNKSFSFPNIFNIAIETDKRSKDKEAKSRPKNAIEVSLLRLRISEIEFADTRLSSQRNKIRMLLKKIRGLEQAFQEKNHEYAKAEADAAWRSSWFED